ncbi:MAG: hypothetical protein LBC74_04990 [Planctomycetaceae bacterium]|nr:hypothetical protein [Planctomycetaceae bacterium]
MKPEPEQEQEKSPVSIKLKLHSHLPAELPTFIQHLIYTNLDAKDRYTNSTIKSGNSKNVCTDYIK